MCWPPFWRWLPRLYQDRSKDCRQCRRSCLGCLDSARRRGSRAFCPCGETHCAWHARQSHRDYQAPEPGPQDPLFLDNTKQRQDHSYQRQQQPDHSVHPMIHRHPVSAPAKLMHVRLRKNLHDCHASRSRWEDSK